MSLSALLIVVAVGQGFSASAQDHHDPGFVLDPPESPRQSKLEAAHRAGLESLKEGDCAEAMSGRLQGSYEPALSPDTEIVGR